MGTASSCAGFPPKNRVWDFFAPPSSHREKSFPTHELAPGCSVGSYETASVHLSARYYEPVSGRFLSVDPLGFAGSTSLYDFGGDPVNHFDADGRCAEQGADWWNPSIMGDSNFNFATGATGQSWITNWGQTADTPASNTTATNNGIQGLQVWMTDDNAPNGFRAATAQETAQFLSNVNQGLMSLAQDIAQGTANYNDQQLAQATKTLDMLDSPAGRFTLTAELGLGLLTDGAMEAVSTPGFGAGLVNNYVNTATMDAAGTQSSLLNSSLAQAPADTLVTVTHFTDPATANTIINGTGTLNPGTFVALPSQVAGMGAQDVESSLEIDAGKGATSATFQTPLSNLGPAFNGPLTSGQKIQFQLINPTAPGPFTPTQ